MKKRIAKSTRADAAEIAEACEALARAEAVVYPTETLYALGVDALSLAGLARLFELKGRERGKPVALIVDGVETAASLVRVFPRQAELLAEAFWPGPLTLVLPAAPGLPAELVGEDGGVGMRIPSHPVALELVRAFGRALTATSANLSGTPAATELAEAKAVFGDRVSRYIDGGRCSAPPSTVVACTSDGKIRILREGSIPEAALWQVLNNS